MRHQRGVAIITAIFILVTSGLLAAAAASLRHSGTSARFRIIAEPVALNAARSGWSGQRTPRAGSCAAGVCSFDFSFPAAASSFSGINVHVVIRTVAVTGSIRN